MSALAISLFGKFTAKYNNQIVKIPSGKMQALLGYLLVCRHRPHSREVLAEIIGEESQAEKNKKHLRQTLWLLHNILDFPTDIMGRPMLLINKDWIQINCQSKFWLDVAEFEKAGNEAQKKTARQIDDNCANMFEEVVKLYVGDLLEDNYQDWCIYERERLQNIYLMLLDRLIGYYYHVGFFEKGLIFAYKTLAIDCTHEKSHRQIMRFHYLSGNRPAALKQYERCVKVLKHELNVSPDKRTVCLYNQLRSDTYRNSVSNEDELQQLNSSTRFSLSDTVMRLKKLDTIINKIQQELRKELEIVESSLNS